MSTYGNCFTINLFGEQAGTSLGVLIDGVLPGTPIDTKVIAESLHRYGESPAYKIVSGMYEGRTTGAPLCALFENAEPDSEPNFTARPGMPDDLYFSKSHGFSDTRANGHFTAKLHAPFIFAGAVARMVLQSKGIKVHAHIKSIGSVEDTAFSDLPLTDETFEKIMHGTLPVYDKRKEMLMKLALEQAKKCGDTLGGQIECAVINLPVGVGSPLFGGLESRISALLFSFMDVKGVEFGEGFASSGMHGSDYNDEIFIDTLKGCPATKTNHSGGVVGGLSNGMPLLFTAALRPSPFIAIEQNTVNYKLRHNTTLPPAQNNPVSVEQYPVLIESAAAIAIVDALYDI